MRDRDAAKVDDGWLARGAAGFALLLAFLAGLYRVRTFDTFFHLAAGRWIVREGRLPDVDPFSFSHRGAPWLDHAWGFQVLLERLHALGGFALLSLLQAVLACSLLAIAARTPWAYALGLLPMFAYREVLEARPHLLGFVCLAAMLTLMQRARGRTVWLVIPVYALWLSAHGSHLLAFVLIVLALLTSVRARRDVLPWGVVLVVCIALALWLSPRALGQGGQHLASAFLEANVSEWYPVTLADLFGTWPGRTFVAIVALSVAGLVLRRERSPSLLLTFVLLLALAFSSRRMLALFALAAQPLWLPFAAHTMERLFARAQALSALAAMLAISSLLPVGPFEPGLGLAADRFPERALAWMRTHPELARVYNAYNFGGYLIWSGWPPAGVFVDGRAITVYPAAFLERFERAYDDPRAFEALRGEYQVDSVLLPSQSERVRTLRRYLAHAWQLRYADSVAEVYTPRP